MHRILLNVGSNELSLESLPDISTKSDYLRRLLTEKKVGDVLCLKFKLAANIIYSCIIGIYLCMYTDKMC